MISSDFLYCIVVRITVLNEAQNVEKLKHDFASHH